FLAVLAPAPKAVARPATDHQQHHPRGDKTAWRMAAPLHRSQRPLREILLLPPPSRSPKYFSRNLWASGTFVTDKLRWFNFIAVSLLELAQLCRHKHQPCSPLACGMAKINFATCSGSSSWTKCWAPGIR